MDDQQVAETASLIYSEYSGLKFDDIALFIRQCKLSHFGKLYDINGAVLLQWLQVYLQERRQAQAQFVEQQEKAKAKEQERLWQEEWNNMTDDEREEYNNRFNSIIDGLQKKFSCSTNHTKTG